jgi:hypothetical protein
VPYSCDMKVGKPVPPAQHSGVWAWFVHGVFLWLAVMALWFHQERLYADAAYYLIHTLDAGFPRVDHERYSLVLAALPPLLALYLGLPLKAIIIIYSLGHVLWAWLAALWCLRLRRPELAVAVVLLQFIGQTFLYFSPMMEICYGGVAAVVLLAHWQAHPIPKGGALVTWWFLALLLVTSHPEHVVTLLVVAGLVWAAAERQIRIPLMALGPIAVMVLLKVLFLSDYERGKFDAGVNRGELRWLDPGHVGEVLLMFLRNYPDLLAMMLLGALVLWRSKARMTVLLLLGGVLAVAIMVNTAMDGEQYSRYMESAYFPLVTCGVLLGVSALVWVGGTAQRALLAAFLLIVVFRSGSIMAHGARLAERSRSIEQLTGECLEQGHAKCVIDAGYGGPIYGTWEWSLPMEGLLIARSLHGTPVSLVTTDDMAFDPAYAELPDTMLLFRRFEPRSIGSMHPFFQVAPGPYEPLDRLATR